MKLVTYQEGGETTVGAAIEGLVVDLNRAYAALHRKQGCSEAPSLANANLPREMTRFLARGPDAVDAAHRALEYVAGLDADHAADARLTRPGAQVRLLPPVPYPPKIVCVARNYAEHAHEAGLELPTLPILFPRFPVTLVAPGAPVVRPTVSMELDWEGELAVVIGRGGRHITKEAALEHVAGYSIFNDVTVRDYQFRVTQYTAGKNFSASGPFGPTLTLKDEIPDPHDLEITTEVNGTQMQHGHTGDMIFDIPTLIEHISEFIDLEPGDVIPTGTPAGVGFKRKPPRFLQPGDVVRVSVTGLGVLENPVVAEEETADDGSRATATHAT